MARIVVRTVSGSKGCHTVPVVQLLLLCTTTTACVCFEARQRPIPRSCGRDVDDLPKSTFSYLMQQRKCFFYVKYRRMWVHTCFYPAHPHCEGPVLCSQCCHTTKNCKCIGNGFQRPVATAFHRYHEWSSRPRHTRTRALVPAVTAAPCS